MRSAAITGNATGVPAITGQNTNPGGVLFSFPTGSIANETSTTGTSADILFDNLEVYRLPAFKDSSASPTVGAVNVKINATASVQTTTTIDADSLSAITMTRNGSAFTDFTPTAADSAPTLLRLAVSAASASPDSLS